MKSDPPTQPTHFYVLLALMLLFFFVDLGTDALVALGKTTVKIGGNSAYTVFFAFYGLAFMAFRSQELTPKEMKAELKDPPADQPPVVDSKH